MTNEQWVSVKDRLPEAQRMILLHTPTSQRAAVDYGFLDYADRLFKVQSMGGWEDVRNFGSEVTHWMPLPAPPLPDCTCPGTFMPDFHYSNCPRAGVRP